MSRLTGKRNDIHKAVQTIKNNNNIQKLLQEDEDFTTVFVKYSKGLTLVSDAVRKHRATPPTVFWIHGETGTGKTRRAVEFAESIGEPFWISNGTLQWFDGYSGQSVAILDDFRTGHCQFSFLLRLLDRYPFSVPYKGGFAKWNPDYIIITAPSEPRVLFNLKTEENMRQLERRITHLVPSDIDGPSLFEVASIAFHREGITLVKDFGVHGINVEGPRTVIDLTQTLDSSEEKSGEDSNELSEEDKEDIDDESIDFSYNKSPIDYNPNTPNYSDLDDIASDLGKPKLKRTYSYSNLEEYVPPQKKQKKEDAAAARILIDLTQEKK